MPEKDTQIELDYDEDTGELSIVREGQAVRIPGRYKTRDMAQRAGEEYCRMRGWCGETTFTAPGAGRI